MTITNPFLSSPVRSPLMGMAQRGIPIPSQQPPQQPPQDPYAAYFTGVTRQPYGVGPSDWWLGSLQNTGRYAGKAPYLDQEAQRMRDLAWQIDADLRARGITPQYNPDYIANQYLQEAGTTAYGGRHWFPGGDPRNIGRTAIERYLSQEGIPQDVRNEMMGRLADIQPDEQAAFQAAMTGHTQADKEAKAKNQRKIGILASLATIPFIGPLATSLSEGLGLSSLAGTAAAGATTGALTSGLTGRNPLFGALEGAFRGAVPVGEILNSAGLGNILPSFGGEVASGFDPLIEGGSGMASPSWTSGFDLPSGPVPSSPLASYAASSGLDPYTLTNQDFRNLMDTSQGTMTLDDMIKQATGYDPKAPLLEDLGKGISPVSFGPETTQQRISLGRRLGEALGLSPETMDTIGTGADYVLNDPLGRTFAAGTLAWLVDNAQQNAAKKAQQQAALAQATARQRFDSSGPAVRTELTRTYHPVNVAEYGLPGSNQAEQNFFTYNRTPLSAARGGALSQLKRLSRTGGGGQSDNIPALLSEGEYVMPADVVSDLGDGSNDRGAQRLDQLRAGVRKHKGRKAGLPPKAKAPAQYMRG